MKKDILVDWTTYVLAEDWVNALKIGLKILHDKEFESKRSLYLNQTHIIITVELNKKNLLPIDFFDLPEEEQMKLIEEASKSIIKGKPMPVIDKELDDLTMEWATCLIQDDYIGALKTGLKILHHYKMEIGRNTWCNNLFKLITNKLKRGDLFPSGNFYYGPSVEEKVKLIESAARKILKE